jgi:hypothetical protein
MSGISINFNKPYPINDSLKDRWRNCVLFSSFVFLFLYIFKPFELSKLPEGHFLIALEYGIVCFVIMSLLNVVVFLTYPKPFAESNWTTGKEILWTMINVILIGLGNYLFSIGKGFIDFTWVNLFWFEVYTITIGAFPITVTTLINQARLSNKFETQSQQLNQQIENRHIDPAIQESSSIRFFSENGTEEIALAPQDFLYAKSDDNYVEIYYINNTLPSRKIIRNTLKNVSNLLGEHEDFFRCHKSYIVNLKQVNHISGNSQGYKLHLKGSEELVPVSRAHNDTIKQYFTVGQ